MLVLKFSERNDQIDEWEERLQNMVVGFNMEENKRVSIPLLVHGRQKIEGADSINNYLDEIEREMTDWQNCSCEV